MRRSAITFILICAALHVRAAGPSTRPGLGSIPYADSGGTGVTFRTWAPNASSVGVKGVFSSWSTIPLTLEGTNGLWSADLPQAAPGHEYKYVINGNTDRRDPRSRRVVNSAGNSVIYDPNAFAWGGDVSTPPWKNDLVIYEMHVGTYNAESFIPSSFDKVIERLDHVRNLGVSAVQVMPINEFAADRSWGYNPADLFAVESALGGPDAFKRFVKACHQRGLAVLVDVVHNHYGPSDLGIWRFDGWSQNGKGGIYFYNDARSTTMWGETRPDYGRPEVRTFIKDQIRMWLNEYHVDGFRWDSVYSMIYYNSGANNLPDGVSLLQEINAEIDGTHPGVIRIAEDHAFDYSMNFDSVWEVSFHDHIQWQVTRTSDADRNMYWLADKITSWPSLQRVLYSESHDTTGDLNSKNRLPYNVDAANPTSRWARKRQLLAAATVLTAPGTPMIFQGQEMNETLSFGSSTPLRWSLTNTYAGIVRAYSDLIHLRRNLTGGTQGLKGTGVVAHHVDNVNKVLALVRWDAGGQVDDVVVLANYSAQPWTNNAYNLQFPSTGTWYSWFNSDATNYSADFGGVGPSFVTATGSPARAQVNMGDYSLQIFSKTPPPQTGIVTLDPAIPTGCVPVSIRYETDGGPLSNASPVLLRIGVNGWQGASDVTMTNDGTDAWYGLFEIPYNTVVLDFAFHNAATNLWDNNLGRDWHIPIAGCANLPSSATVTPEFPVGCVPLYIRYDENSGPLNGATGVFAHIGVNGWQAVQTLPLTEGPDGVWTMNFPTPAETWQVDFVFHNGAAVDRIWDNHNGSDWHVFVAECLSTDATGITITNPPGDLVVPDSTESFDLSGRAGNEVMGQIRWTNLLNHTAGVAEAAPAWAISCIPLAEGVNLIRVTGTNDGVNPNDGAHDNATNGTYASGNNWLSGQNGGSGWGGGWQLTAGANSGHFRATLPDASNLDIGQAAWGLWANNGGLSEAIRPLAAGLTAGDVLRARMENNNIAGGGSTGIGLRNRFDQNLVEFFFLGGGTNYLINDESPGRNTGIPWSPHGLTVTFELLTAGSYALTVEGAQTQTFFGVFAHTSETRARRVRFWNYNAGPGQDANFYVSEIGITGGPLDSTAVEDEINITRPFGPFSDQDGDGFLKWEEELAGTNPADASSHLPDLGHAPSGKLFSVQLANSAAGRAYDLYWRTNLTEGGWIRCGLDALGWGGPITLVATTETDSAFYRTGVFLP